MSYSTKAHNLVICGKQSVDGIGDGGGIHNDETETRFELRFIPRLCFIIQSNSAVGLSQSSQKQRSD